MKLRIMGTFASHPVGSTVKFTPGHTTTPVTAKVTAHDGAFLVTKDATGFVRKTRPGACSAG